MKIVSQRILRMSLLISSIIFFNYMVRLISSSSKLDTSTNVSLPITTPEQLKGSEHFHKWLSLVYIVIVMFKYKTFNEQLGLYIAFFVIMNIVYYPFNCVCKDPTGWVCQKDTAPSDPRCQRIINEVKEVNIELDKQMVEVKASKTKVIEALKNNLFPTFPVPYIKKMKDDLFNIPHLQNMNRVVPRVSISCEINIGAILKALKKRVLNKIGKPFRKKRWGKRFRR